MKNFYGGLWIVMLIMLTPFDSKIFAQENLSIVIIVDDALNKTVSLEKLADSSRQIIQDREITAKNQALNGSVKTVTLVASKIAKEVSPQEVVFVFEETDKLTIAVLRYGADRLVGRRYAKENIPSSGIEEFISLSIKSAMTPIAWEEPNVSTPQGALEQNNADKTAFSIPLPPKTTENESAEAKKETPETPDDEKLKDEEQQEKKTADEELEAEAPATMEPLAVEEETTYLLSAELFGSSRYLHTSGDFEGTVSGGLVFARDDFPGEIEFNFGGWFTPSTISDDKGHTVDLSRVNSQLRIAYLTQGALRYGIGAVMGFEYMRVSPVNGFVNGKTQGVANAFNALDLGLVAEVEKNVYFFVRGAENLYFRPVEFAVKNATGGKSAIYQTTRFETVISFGFKMTFWGI